jgi:hypothetical protein
MKQRFSASAALYTFSIRRCDTDEQVSCPGLKERFDFIFIVWTDIK